MPKVVISVRSRVREFPNEGLEDQNGKLICTFCLTELDYFKKSIIVTHCDGAKHQKFKRESFYTSAYIQNRYKN